MTNQISKVFQSFAELALLAFLEKNAFPELLITFKNWILYCNFLFVIDI